ncbi:GntR family transcriptional regulator [Marivibrio halodurans]|uniref:GntR family transcriptional regulator n=1 Tax=Marivibrio halodurans TaxID=2039722 RepID=A0A8J7V2B8_9PROT|nr:GntR family transcriptional regulator [Marivibrio halodurans]MBP5857006.1 GntR family transcriptional regulator [Marivibrio halodurans]
MASSTENATQVEKATQALREAVLSGVYGGDEKLREVPLSEMLGVSRTVVRLALSALELEGLVVHAPNRGFRTRAFSLEEVTDAIIVRGELEAIAARYICERGLSVDDRERFQDILARMEQVLADGFAEVEGRLAWMDLVAAFHGLLVSASGSPAIEATIAQLSRIPLVAPKSVVFDLSSADYSRDRVLDMFETRKQLVEALMNRQGGRAAALMVGYAYQACSNKRASFESMRSGRRLSMVPGMGLINRRDERTAPGPWK